MDPISATSSRNPSVSLEPTAPPPPPPPATPAAPSAPAREPSLSVSYGQTPNASRMQTLLCPPAGQRVQPPTMEGEQIRNRLGIAPVRADHTQSNAMQETLNEHHVPALVALGVDAARTGVEVAEIAGVHPAGMTAAGVMTAEVTAGLVGMGVVVYELGTELRNNLTGHTMPTPSAVAAVREEENANAALDQRAADGALAVQYRQGASSGLNGAPAARVTDRAYMMGYEAGQARRSECGPARIDAERAAAPHLLPTSARPRLGGSRDVGSL